MYTDQAPVSVHMPEERHGYRSLAQHTHTAHTKQKGTIQPIQHTDCTTGQVSLHGGGDGNYTDYLLKN